MSSYSFIFRIEGGKIAVYNKVGNKFECTPFNGEVFQLFGSDFWEVWRKNFSFPPESGRIDFAFVSTDPNLQDFHLPENFRKTDHSEWSKSAVLAFMQNLFPVKPYNLLEDGQSIHSATERNAVNYYLTRFNVEKEKPQEEAPTTIYEIMRDEPLPPELRKVLKKDL